MLNDVCFAITFDGFEKLSKEAQIEIMELYAPAFAVASHIIDGDNEDRTDVDHEPWLAKLTVSQAREFLKDASDDVRNAVRTMCEGSTPRFRLLDVANATGKDATELRYVWAALTRRMRSVTNDKKKSLELVYWLGETIYDDDGEYADEPGQLSTKTYKSFRTALGMD